MKNLKFLFTTLLLLCSIVVSAHDFEVGGIYYNITDETNKTVEVTFRGKYNDSYSNEYTGSVVIPESVSYGGTTYSVTSIGSNAFNECSVLTSIIIPNSVTSIGGYAFNDCSGLTSIEIPNSVTSIGDYAFESTAWYNNQPEGLLVMDGWLLGYKGEKPTGELVIPSNVTNIASSAFSGCSGLTSIEIPNSVTSIGDWAFYYCYGLTSIEIPNSVTSIGDGAFYNCSGLTSIEIPNSVTSIGEKAFYYCDGLTSVTIPNSVTSIGYDAFYGCSGLTSIEIPNSVTSIGNFAFYGCANLKTVINFSNLTFSKGSSDYGYVAYYVDKVINVPNGFVEGDFLFGKPGDVNTLLYYLGNDAELTLPQSCNGENYVIAADVFKNNTSITSIEIPNSVTSIGDYAFEYCSGLTSITIPNSVTSLGNYAFSGCSGLTSIEIPNSVTSIGNGAFYGCSGLTSVTIPNSVTSIGESAFKGCSGLTSITIPNSVTSIGYCAFESTAWYNNQSEGVVYAGKFLYRYKGTMPANTSIVVKEGTTQICNSAFSGCSGLTSVTIPNSVTSIGGEAFYRCNNLKTVINYSNLTFSKGSSNYGYVAYYANKVINAPNAFFEGDFVFSVIDSVNTLAVYLGNDTEITLPNDYNGESYVVGESAFRGYSNLTSIEIPNSVTSIGSSAFYGCSGLKSVTIGNSVTSIGRSAFYGCSGLTSIEIPNSVTSIGGEAFSGCSGLTSIVIPNSVTSIGYQAFKDCGNIETLYVSSSIESIGDEAFVGCDKITEIKIGLEKPIRASANIFSYAAYDNAVLYIPNGTKSLYEKREPWNLFFYIEEIENITPTYSVTFMLDGDVYATYTLEVGAEIPTFNKPIKEGYTFSGWSEIPATMPAEDIVVSGFFIKDDTAVDDVKEQTTENNVVYDLQGRVVENPTKGIYIINGKKMLVK